MISHLSIRIFLVLVIPITSELVVAGPPKAEPKLIKDDKVTLGTPKSSDLKSELERVLAKFPQSKPSESEMDQLMTKLRSYHDHPSASKTQIQTLHKSRFERSQ